MKNLRNLFTALICSIVSSFTYAQTVGMTDVEMINLVVSYEMNQLCSPASDNNPNEWRVKETLMLEIGQGVAHSYVVRERNKLFGQFQMLAQKNRWKIEMFQLHALVGETYIGYPKKGKLMQVVDLDAAGVYKYTESIPKIKWKMEAGQKDIHGYNCQQASCTFRGRQYEVWFTTDIPLSYGPWKLQGLPGLILEAKDSKDEYHFTAVGIEKGKNDKKIQFYAEPIRDIKRNRALKMEKMLHKDHGAFAADYGVTFRMEGGFEHMPVPYIPIELQ